MSRVKLLSSAWLLTLALFLAPCVTAAETPLMGAEAYFNRGVAYMNKQQYDDAIADLTKALEINSRIAEAYLNRGVAYVSKQMYDEPIADFNKAEILGLQIDPEFLKDLREALRRNH